MIKKNKDNQVLDIEKSSGNVFADLGVPDADKYLAKAELARQINNILKKRGLKQIEAAEILVVDQPKISALARGQLDDFSIERLMHFLNRLDHDICIVIKRRPTRRKSHGVLQVAFG